MGKEAKIGIAVIVVLVLVLGVVLAKRIIGGRQEPLASSADEDGSPANVTNDDAAGKATVLAPKMASSQRRKESPLEIGQMVIASDESGSRRHERSSKAPAAPSLMPEPPQPQPASASDRYAASYSPALPQSAEPESRSEIPGVAAAGQGSDPFVGREPSRHNRDAEQGEHASRTNTPSQTVSYGQDYRYSPEPTLSQPAEPVRPYGHNNARSAPTTSYGAGSAASSAPYGTASSPRSTTPYGGSSAVPRLTTLSGLPHGGRELRREDGTYEIQPNDSYWTISEKLYGTGAYFKALASHNRKKIPQEEQLPVGETISAPEIAHLEKAYPELCPKPNHRDSGKKRPATISTAQPYGGGRHYVVQEGDTLFEIARHELGKASRWSEIYDLNRDQLGSDYNYLPRGLQLTLPGNEPTSNVARRPEINAPYRR